MARRPAAGPVLPHRGAAMTSRGAKPSGHQVHPRRFVLIRETDPSGVSGIGTVAEGVQFSDGTIALRWRGPHPATAVWNSITNVLAVHGHTGATAARWLDQPVKPPPGDVDHGRGR